MASKAFIGVLLSIWVCLVSGQKKLPRISRQAHMQVSPCQPERIFLAAEASNSPIIDQLRGQLENRKSLTVEDYVDGVKVLNSRIRGIVKDKKLIAVVGRSYAHCNLDGIARFEKSMEDALEIVKALRTQEEQSSYKYTTEKFLDPVLYMPLFIVQENGFMHWRTYWVDAVHGVIISSHDNIHKGCAPTRNRSPHGFGVKGYRRDLTGLVSPAKINGTFIMRSLDKGQTTYDLQYDFTKLGKLLYKDIASNKGIVWAGKYNAMMVDGQYFSAKTVEFLQTRHGFNFTSFYPSGVITIAHFFKGSGAAYDGKHFFYGNGEEEDGIPLTADGGIVAHEIVHAVTRATSRLDYIDYSGALNEAFSDILSVTFQDWMGNRNWVIGSDAISKSGLRSFENPGLYRQPSHVAGLVFLGEDFDNGGIHFNSGVPNHWFYLLSEGGKNANKEFRTGKTVQGVGLKVAEEVMYRSFTSLAEDADFCDARGATIAVAKAFKGVVQSVREAWDEVGVTDEFCANDKPIVRLSPSPTPFVDPCYGLCPDGFSCVHWVNRHTQQLSFFCVDCSYFQIREKGKVSSCCEYKPMFGCRRTKSTRCVADDKNVFYKDNQKPVFKKKHGPICYNVPNFNLNRGACKITWVKGELVCRYKQAREGAEPVQKQ